MTTMTDGEILDAMKDGKIEIFPFNPKQLQGCSYDVMRGEWLVLNKNPIHNPRTWSLRHNAFLLTHTHEFIRVADDIQFKVHTVSTFRREGADSCASAGFGDPGYCNRITLEVKHDALEPVAVPRFAIIAQIEFIQLRRRVLRSYGASHGRYSKHATIAEAVAAWSPSQMLSRGIKAGDTPADQVQPLHVP